MSRLVETKKKKKKIASSTTLTTGDPDLNIKRFNTAMGTNFDVTPATPGIEAAKEAAEETNDNISSENTGCDDSSCDSGNSSSDAGGSEGSGLSEALKNYRALREAQAFIGKLHKAVDVPNQVQIIPQDKIEKAIRSLDPEEEFTLGYITPVDLQHKALNDGVSLLKCTQFTGFTGVDYRDADTNANTKDARINKATSQIKDPSKHKGEFSADYDQTNKTVNRYTNKNNEAMRTILFYSTPGSIPKVAYFIDLKDGKGFKQVKKANIETEITNALSAKGSLGNITTADIHNILYPNKPYVAQKSASGADKPRVFSLYTSQIYYLNIPGISVKLGASLVEHFKALNNADTITEAYLTEKKKRYSKPRIVKRYYIRPQNIWCGNKLDILKTLIKLGDENCSIYTLNNLKDNTDVQELTSDDIIYYYDDGILYDKNHVKVMDYDLYIKHEEDRKKFPSKPDVEKGEAKDEYSDRIVEPRENVRDNVAHEGLTKKLIEAVRPGFDIAQLKPLIGAKVIFKTNMMQTGEYGTIIDIKLNDDGRITCTIEFSNGKIRQFDLEMACLDNAYLTFESAADFELLQQVINANKATPEEIKQLKIEHAKAAGVEEAEKLFGTDAGEQKYKQCKKHKDNWLTDEEEAFLDRYTELREIEKAKERTRRSIEKAEGKATETLNDLKTVGKEIASSTDILAIDDWLRKHVIGFKFDLPDFNNLPIDAPDSLKARLIKTFDDMSGSYPQVMNNPEHFELITRGPEKVKSYYGFWGLNGTVKFDTDFNSFPIEIKDMVALAVKKSQERGHRALMPQSTDKSITNIYFCFALLDLFNNDPDFYKKSSNITGLFDDDDNDGGDDFGEAFKLDFEAINAYGEKLNEALEDDVCCICGEPIEGYGNNPYPVKEEGRCCDACNIKFVIPARLQAMMDYRRED